MGLQRQTWQNGMGWPEHHGREKGKACPPFLQSWVAWKGNLGKFRAQNLANSSFPNMLGKCVPELNAEGNHAKMKKWKCPNSQFNVAKHVNGTIWQKATGSTVGYFINGAKMAHLLCHCEKRILGLSPHSYQFSGLCGSLPFLTWNIALSHKINSIFGGRKH